MTASGPAPDVCDGTSAVGESRHRIPGASVGQPTEACLAPLPLALAAHRRKPLDPDQGGHSTAAKSGAWHDGFPTSKLPWGLHMSYWAWLKLIALSVSISMVTTAIGLAIWWFATHHRFA